VINPTKGLPGVKPHVAVRLPDGRIFDETIIDNIRVNNRGVIPKSIQKYERYDTFPPEIYDELIDVYANVAKLPGK
jgi:hypothetical protein